MAVSTVSPMADSTVVMMAATMDLTTAVSMVCWMVALMAASTDRHWAGSRVLHSAA